MNKIPFYIVTGFLGSGKTTLIKNIIKSYSSAQKLAVVQNEFAPENVDSLELSLMSEHFDVLEINKGSVFCVCLINDFIPSLKEFIELKSPDVILLEATGLADPISIVELIESPELRDIISLARIYSVVDLNNFDKLKNNQRVIHQIRIADEVILNKTDLSDKNSESAANEIRRINPFAKIFTSEYCNIDMNNFLNSDLSSVYERKEELKRIKSAGRPIIGVKVFKSGKKFDKESIENFFNNLDDNVYRIKGYLTLSSGKSAAVQYVFGQFDITPLDNSIGNSLLIVMGKNTSVSSIHKSLIQIAA